MTRDPLRPAAHGGHSAVFAHAAAAQPAPAAPATPERGSLFRPAALAAMGPQAHGRVVLVPSLSHAVITAFFALVGLAVAAALALVSYSPKARVTGQLVPTAGLVRVAAMAPGRVQPAELAQGQRVAAGQVLVTVHSERSAAEPGPSREAQLREQLAQQRQSLQRDRAALAEQLAERQRAAAARLQLIDADEARLREQLAVAQRIADHAVNTHQSKAKLAAEGFLSAAAVAEADAGVLTRQQEILALQRQLEGVRGSRVALRDEAASIAAQMRRQTEAAARDSLALAAQITEVDSRASHTLRAPHASLVVAVLARAGQSVAAGEPLVVLMAEDDRLVAELYVPSRDAGFIRPGQTVQLRYDAYASARYGQARGVVEDVGTSAMTAAELSQLALPAELARQSAAGIFRVRVRLERQDFAARGASVALRPGSTLQASVELGSRRLYESLFEPLLALRGWL